MFCGAHLVKEPPFGPLEVLEKSKRANPSPNSWTRELVSNSHSNQTLGPAPARGLAPEVRAFPKPGGLEWTAQMLCCAANCIVMLGSLPVFAHEGLGREDNGRKAITKKVCRFLCEISVLEGSNSGCKASGKHGMMELLPPPCLTP